jgi:hypothetical protein
MSLNCGHQRSYLFISQVIYEHGELWWDDTDSVKLMISLTELTGSSSSSHILLKPEEPAKEVMNLSLRNAFHASKGF